MRNIKFLIPLLIFIQTTQLTANSFETNCKKCHFQTRQLQMFISKYTLKYSSEHKIKEAIFKYLKNPTKDNSVMPVGFLNRFGIKEKSNLDDNELKNAIDIYYKEYNLKNIIK